MGGRGRIVGRLKLGEGGKIGKIEEELAGWGRERIVYKPRSERRIGQTGEEGKNLAVRGGRLDKLRGKGLARQSKEIGHAGRGDGGGQESSQLLLRLSAGLLINYARRQLVLSSFPRCNRPPSKGRDGAYPRS